MARNKIRRKVKKKKTSHIKKKEQTSKPQVVSLDISKPFTNSRFQVALVPQVKHPKSFISNTPIGPAGTYLATFSLCIPGRTITYFENLNVDDIMNSGESLLKLSDGEKTTVVLKDEVEYGKWETIAEVQFSTNSDGFLSKAEIKVEANNFEDAEEKAYNAVTSILSQWSFYGDVPIDINGYKIVEEKTKSIWFDFGFLGTERVLHVKQGVHQEYPSKNDYKKLFASYREALNSENPYYKFLCFFKVIEGIHKIRNYRKQELLIKGIPYREQRERIPTDIEIIEKFAGQSANFNPFLGKKFTKVIDHYRDLIRNAIAHLDPTNDDLFYDNCFEIRQCNRAIPIIKYISRVMLQNELKEHTHWVNDGILWNEYQSKEVQ